MKTPAHAPSSPPPGLVLGLALAALSLLSSCGKVESSSAEPPVSLAVVISPALEEAVRADVKAKVLALVMRVPPGSSVQVVDGLTLSTVSRLRIPVGRLGANPATRIRPLAAELAGLDRFIASSPPGDGATGRLLLPEALERVATTCEASSIVVIGNALYLESPFQMADAFVPNDAHLGVDPGVSVFGAKGRETLLQGISVHFGCPFGEEIFANHAHRHGVLRFWHLYIDALGGNLASFGDVSSAFDRCLRPELVEIQKLVFSQEVRPGEAPAMVQMVVAPSWLEAAPPSTPQPLPEVPSPLPVRVGIRWPASKGSHPVDLDLYLKLSDGSEEVYFGYRETARLRFFKDYRAGGDAWEFIEFKEPLLPEDFVTLLSSCHANLYSGQLSEPLHAELRLAIGDRVYSQPFTLEAGRGNHGDDRHGSRQNAHWVAFDLPALANLSPAPER